MAEIMERLRRGEAVAVGAGLYGLCRDCGSIIRLNKFLFGSLHICTDAIQDAPKETHG